jgi:hypothetical protein
MALQKDSQEIKKEGCSTTRDIQTIGAMDIENMCNFGH